MGLRWLRLYVTCFWGLLFFSGVQAAQLSLSTLYNGLKKYQPDYDNQTYAQPKTNYLNINQANWLLQTPNAWGQSLKQYNDAISQADTSHGQKINALYFLPTCQDDSQCQGGRYCALPVFAAPGTPYLCLGPEQAFQNTLYSAILSANSSVDITTLQPESLSQSAFTTDAFSPTLKNALVQLATKANFKHKSITVTLLQGGDQAITSGKKSARKIQQSNLLYPQRKFVQSVVNDPRFPKDTTYFNLYVATERSCLMLGNCLGDATQKSVMFKASWNHGKIVDVDHSKLITGGENFWGNDYLETAPVNDVNLEMTGPVLQGADFYIKTLWKFVRTHHGQNVSNYCASYHGGKITNDCADPSVFAFGQTTLPQDDPGYPVQAMYVSKLNYNVLGRNADASELARVIAFKNASKTIKISQQALYFKLGGQVLHPIQTPEGTVIQALATAINNGVSVYIVTSNLVGMDYSSEVSSEYVRQDIAKQLVALFPAVYPTIADAVIKVDQYLKIKTLAYWHADSQAGATFNHDKLWIVDDRVFYIGSHNIYPSALQQFGVIIEDDNKQVVDQLEKRLWMPLYTESVDRGKG